MKLMRTACVALGIVLLGGIGQAWAQIQIPYDLSVSKTDGVDTVAPDDQIIYTITVSNLANPITGAIFTDIMPADLSAVSWSLHRQYGITRCH